MKIITLIVAPCFRVGREFRSLYSISLASNYNHKDARWFPEIQEGDVSIFYQSLKSFQRSNLVICKLPNSFHYLRNAKNYAHIVAYLMLYVEYTNFACSM